MTLTPSQTQALDALEALLLDGYVPVLTTELSYISNGTEIYDITSRRELEALLHRKGLIRPAQHITRPEAADLSSALITQGIHLDQWLKDRKYQSDLDTLNSLWADYLQHGDWNDNDTCLRVLVLGLVKKHKLDLLGTYLKKPADTSIHSVRILNHVAKKNATQAAISFN